MRDIIRKLKRKLKKTDTVERCGLVLKDGTIVNVQNVHEQPELGFRIAGADILEHESELLGTWHTHPGQTSVYSQEDHFCFLNWPDLTHFVVGTDGVRSYIVEEGIVRECI